MTATRTSHPLMAIALIICIFVLIALTTAVIFFFAISTASSVKKEQQEIEANQKTEEAAKKEATMHTPASPITASTPAEFPLYGDGYATEENGLKAYLDPHRTCTRSFEKGSRYVFVEDPTITFNDLPGNNINHTEWLKKPAGKYMVYPLKGVEKIHFRWWQ